jgi:capsular polysaccharide biosynthesis protein
MFDRVFYLRLKDSLPWVKQYFVYFSKAPLRIKKLISQKLRRVPWARQWLCLPAPNDHEFFVSRVNSADSQWIELESPSEFSHQIPALSHEANSWYFEQNARVLVDSVGLAILNQGYVFGHHAGQYLNSRQEYLWDLGRENWRYFGALFMDSVLRLPKPTRLPGTAAVLAHEYAYSNFSHWIFDVLPKISILRKAGLFDQVDWFLVGHSDKEYQLQSLLHLGVPRHKIIHFSEISHFQAETLLLPRLCGYQLQHHSPWKISFLTESFGGCRPSTQARRLFVSRKDASFRHLLGEDNLFEKLSQLGFEHVCLSGLGLQDTVKLFSDAEAVVGPFGSGLMNIAFCHPGTKVVEIVTPAFYNCYHWYLSGVLNLRHAVYFGDGGSIDPRKSPNQGTKDIYINVDNCFDFVRRFLETS